MARLLTCHTKSSAFLSFPLLTFPRNFSDGFYTYEGSDAADVPDNNGMPKNNVFTNNVVADVDIGVHIKEGEDNEFVGELFLPLCFFRGLSVPRLLHRLGSGP